MYKILKKEDLAESVKRMKVKAPAIGKKAQPGQFIILRVNQAGERIPLTICDLDKDGDTITIVFQEVGKTTKHLGTLSEGDSILDLVGPLGKPSEIEKFGKVVCVGGGVGTAVVYPITRALYEAGNEIISIVGARSADLLILEDEMEAVSNSLIITTDDGTKGRRGLVTEPLKEILEAEKVNRVIAIGPAIMMKFVAKTTEPFGVKTIVSLNPIMVDGTGMCGGCRVTVGGEKKFACVDGPEFDGHQVDFDELQKRLGMYKGHESEADECRLKGASGG